MLVNYRVKKDSEPTLAPCFLPEFLASSFVLIKQICSVLLLPSAKFLPLLLEFHMSQFSPPNLSVVRNQFIKSYHKSL